MKHCPHCGEPLAEASQQPWYFRTSNIVIGLLSVGPLALPMIWWHPRIKGLWKLLITLGVGLLTWLCIVLVLRLLSHLADQLELLESL